MLVQVGPGFLLMQDNARPHVAGVCQQFLQDKGIDAMDWPARSPDLNPIEHIWDIMYRSIHQRHACTTDCPGVGGCFSPAIELHLLNMACLLLSFCWDVGYALPYPPYIAKQKWHRKTSIVPRCVRGRHAHMCALEQDGKPDPQTTLEMPDLNTSDRTRHTALEQRFCLPMASQLLAALFLQPDVLQRQPTHAFALGSSVSSYAHLVPDPLLHQPPSSTSDHTSQSDPSLLRTPRLMSQAPPSSARLHRHHPFYGAAVGVKSSSGSQSLNSHCNNRYEKTLACALSLDLCGGGRGCGEQRRGRGLENTSVT
ncbi:hypothetical protein L3Q82_000676 [Scortum barcoo]|uniref:Uncharacterized protein n=1 Tax=Scortum barcoo TaxID=214431 RepID=A0ACB8WFH3_9TELE|nr:hypothetical protein L3Q82_000676 [Scortum barcoo]